MKYLLCIICLLLLSGCADVVPCGEIRDPVGFLYGLWHGMILSFAFIYSLFSDGTAIYATYNNGGWYDFGFALGVGALISGSRGR